MMKMKPKLLLHSCCAPCSSSSIERLKDAYDVTVFYYNPNILPQCEYEKRKAEQIGFIEIQNVERKMQNLSAIKFIDGDYNQEDFASAIKGKEHLLEKSERCFACYKFRMVKTRDVAASQGFDFFTTTLSVSPHKNSSWILDIGKSLENDKVKFLAKDFKKQDGYKRSLELSKQYNFYRQDYCGCGVGKTIKT